MKTIPYAHQQKEYDYSKDLPVRGIFWEMGCGKSKLAIDTACYLYEQGKIDCLLVIAPSGVHRNWIVEEMEAHCWFDDWYGFHWISSKANTKKAEEVREELLDYEGLAVLAINYDAINTERGMAYVTEVLQRRTCMMVLDESARIKNPSAKRTKRVMKLAPLAPYRRVMTGTPVANSPFDIYAQLRFLDEAVWDSLGCRRFPSFRRMFGIYEKQHFSGRSFDQLVGYRNLAKLKPIIDAYCTRLQKEDVLDLPEKVYTIHPVETTAEQRKHYQRLAEDYLTVLESGGVVEAPMAITRLLRLQQVLCGYLPSGKDDGEMSVMKKNPRLDALTEIAEDIPHQAIVWCRFQQDVDLVAERLREMGKNVVTYDGRTSDTMRATALAEFKSGDADFFVANPAAAGEGLTLTQAKTVIYYSNSFRLDQRLQSEDRAHRIGQTHSVQYIDLVVPGTIDDYIVEALRTKRDIASTITGDELGEWVK